MNQITSNQIPTNIPCKITGFEETRQIHVVRDQSNQPTDLQPDEPKTVLHLQLPKGQTIKAAVPYDDFVSQVLPQLEGSAATEPVASSPERLLAVKDQTRA